MGGRDEAGFLPPITLIPQSGHHSQHQPSTPKLAAQPSTCGLQVVRPVSARSTGTCERTAPTMGNLRMVEAGNRGKKKSEGSCQASSTQLPGWM